MAATPWTHQRSPSHAETAETALQSLSTTSLRVLNKRPFHCLPSGVATRGIGIAPTSGLQWREIAEMTYTSITTVTPRLHSGHAATTCPGSDLRFQCIRHTGAETVA
jgi:hypothetical protein